MALGVSADDFTQIQSDLAVSVTYKPVTRVIDPIYGAETNSYGTSGKTWVFFKRSSTIDLTKWGITDVGDAYLIVPNDVTISYGDRVAYQSETFEYTPSCMGAVRYSNSVAMYNYYTLKLVDR